MSRIDVNMISIYERKILREFRRNLGKWNVEKKMKFRALSLIKNLALLTSSKYNELNWQVPLSEWTKTTPLKVFNAQPIGTRRTDRPILRWIDGLEKDLLV
ncbi:hypothetical protein TNCV_4272551 [Trichonephila clavipes]|nr:hypothetical protein TNCV_4272551 [Trichonephila clavipes]